MTVTEAQAFDALCRTNLEAFTCKAFQVLEPGRPFEYNWHIGCICEHLQAVMDGELQDLIINIAPRMLKSVIVGQIYQAFVLGHHPNHQFIGASYAHSLAERNVMKTRYILQSDWYKRLFPNVVISTDMNQKDYFTTSVNGQYKGTGIGGTITGFGCDTLVIDDPINPKEAVSDTIRMGAIEEIRSTLFSRFNKFDDRRFIMIMQRLHDADPTGDLLKDGGYYHLKLPAVAPSHLHFDLRGKTWDMEEGEYLTQRLGESALAKLEVDLGKYHFAGQYLQEPVPIGGGDFKPEWVQHYRNGAIKVRDMNLCILVDPAGGEELNKKKKKFSDWTAMIVIGLGTDNNYYILDIIRDRLNPTERVETLFMLHRKWNEATGKSPKVGYEKYGMMTDTHYIAERKEKDSYHFQVIELGGTMGKEERIRRLIPDLQNSRWYLPDSLIYIDGEGRRFDLVQELKQGEMVTFPRARHDDMLDAWSRIYETDLNMVFPKPKVGMVQKALTNRGGSSSDWQDF